MATLLAILEEVADGRATAHALADAITAVRAELDETRADFTASTQRLPPPVHDAVRPFIDQALTNLDAYSQALDVLERYMSSGDRHTLVQGQEQVRRCMDETSLGFSAYRDAVLVATGPTDIPNLNLLLQAYEELKQGTAPPEKLLVVAERERRRAEAELQRLDRTGSSLVKVVALARGWKDHEECMAALIEAVKEQDEREVEAYLREARETFSDLKRLIPAAQEALDSQGPSPSPLVNIVLTLGRGLAAGSIPEAAFLQAANSLRENIRNTASQLEVLAGLGDDPSLEQPLHQVREAMKVYQDGFSAVDRFLHDRRLSTLQDGLKTLEAAAQALHLIQQQVLEAAEKANQVTVACIRCGHANASGRARCERCSTNLPMSEQAPVTLREFGENGGEAPADTLIVSATLQKVYEAVNGAADGSMDTDAYLSRLQWFEDQLNSHAASLPGDFTEEQEEMVVQALDAFHTALAELRRFPDTHDKHHLVEGGRMCNDAAHLLTRVASPPPAVASRLAARSSEDEDGEEIVG